MYGDTEPDTGPMQMQRSATIEGAKDAAGSEVIIITLHTKSSSAEIEKPDWRKD